MLSIDLIKPQDSRIKAYFRSRKTDCESLPQNMTLNHRISKDSYNKGLQKLVQLWNRVFDLSEDEELREDLHETVGVLYYTDFRLGDRMPKVKVYIPVRHFAINDDKIASSIIEYFEEIGQDQYTLAYREVLKEVL